MTAAKKTAIAGVCALALGIFAGCGGGRAPGTVPLAGGADALQPTAHSQSLTDILSELARSQPPAGTDPGVFFALKEELARQLNSRGASRIVCKPPEDECNRQVWLAVEGGPGNYTLNWYYRNWGDYDQNGKVAIADITPLAVHFGQSYDVEAEPQCLLAAVDGDGNGTIGIADVTPIAVNFGVTCSGYRVESSNSELSGYVYSDFAELDAAAGEGRLQLQHALGTPAHLYYRVAPVDDASQPGVASDPVLIPGDPPEVLSVEPLEGLEDESVQFSATVESAVPVAYSWSFGGGASPDSTTTESPTVTLGVPGEYGASLTVTSVYGADTYEFTLTVLGAAPVIVSVAPTSGDEGQSVKFTAEVTGAGGTSYEWDFGGGASPNTSTVASPVVTLGAPGEYNASLLVWNAQGSDEFPFTLHVLESYDYAWNYAVYIAGDNSLAEVAFVDIDEMEAVGSTADVAVNVEIESWDYWSEIGYPTVERFLVVPNGVAMEFDTSGSPANESFSREDHDSASVEALAGYLEWSLGNFDAQSNALVLWDHGAGWDNGKSTSGLICDDTAGTMLADYEVAGVMAATGAYWEHLAMDACVMGSVEVAYEYRDVAHYLLFSQESVPWNGFNYTPICQALAADPNIDPYDLGQATVDSYIGYYTEHPDESGGGVTLGIVDLAKMDALVAALDAFAQLVISNAEAEKEPFGAAADQSQYTGSWLGDVDAVDFMTLYRAETANPQIQTAIDSVLNALDDFVLYFDSMTDGMDFSHYHGVSLWVPDAWDYQYMQSEYETTSFCNETRWYDMLDAVIGYSGELVPADIVAELSWDTEADVDLYLHEPDPWDPEGSWNSPYMEYSANGVFSPDSYDSGESFESWDSNEEVMPGTYTFAANFVWGDAPDDYANVTLDLYEDGELTFNETIYMDEDQPIDEEFGPGWYIYGWLEKGRGKRGSSVRMWRDAPNRLIIQLQLAPRPKPKQR